MSGKSLTATASEFGEIRANDGTRIGYRRTGQGPAVILVHGAMMTSQLFEGLAAALAADFTVYSPDRRGRGMSGPTGPGYGIATEIADLAALLRETGAHNVFGLSSGAVISLNAALELPEIRNLALYEPPLAVPGNTTVREWGARYEREVAAGRLGAALVSVMKGTGDKGSFTSLPRPLLLPLMALAVRFDQGDDSRPPMRTVIPTVRYDLTLVREAGDVWDRLGELHCRALLLGGDRSIDYLGAALDRLATALPGAERVVLAGAGHTVSFTDEHRELVAAQLRGFFD